MSSIDDVWAEMKASALPKSQPSTTSAPKVSSGKPVIRLKSRDPDNANVANVPRGAADVLESIQREINGISDDRVETRRTSFRALMDALIVTDPIEGQPASNVIAGLAAVLKSALKRFSDPVETCREMAIRLVLEHMRLTSGPVSSLPYLLPVLVFRVVHAPDDSQRAEPSEELRLLLARLVHLTVERVHASDWPRFLNDLVPILISLLDDPFPAVRQETCLAIRQLSIASELLEPLKGCSLHLLAALIPCLVSRHSRLRVLTIEAIQPLMYARGAEMIRQLTGFREANVIPIAAFYHGDQRINYFGKLTTDDSPLVRAAFYRMLAAWWTDLPERYDYETLLFPYLLAGLWDWSHEVQQQVLDALDRIGAEHEKDNFSRLREELLYASRAEAKLPQFSRQLPNVLPAPFTARPRLGTRLVLRTQLSRLLTAIIAELGDWHLNLKRHALCLLRTLLVAAEEHATEHVLRLLPLLAKLVHALLLQEAEQVEKLRSGTAAAANNFAGSSTAVSESMSKKPQSAVISADTLDQDPFHRNEDLKSPALDCLALLSRYVHTDVLMPLLLPSMRSFEQCEFFWKMTVQSDAPKAAITSENDSAGSEQQAMISEAVHALGGLSTNCRLCVLLQVIKFAPPEWILPYADCILELFFIDEYANIVDAQQLQLTTSIISRLVQLTGKQWLNGNHVPLNSFSSSFSSKSTALQSDSTENLHLHPILRLNRSRAFLIYVVHTRCLAWSAYKSAWLNHSSDSIEVPSLTHFWLLPLPVALRNGFEYVQPIPIALAEQINSELNACIEVLSRNHDELTTVDQIRSAYLPALLINLCSMKSSFSQMNFRHSDLVSLWYCVYQLSALSAIKHEAALESIYVDLIESASSNLSSSLCFRLSQAIMISLQNSSQLNLNIRCKVFAQFFASIIQPAITSTISRFHEKSNQNQSSVFPVHDWLWMLVETFRLSFTALSSVIRNADLSHVALALSQWADVDSRAKARSQLIQAVSALGSVDSQVNLSVRAEIVAILERRQADADETVSQDATQAIRHWSKA